MFTGLGTISRSERLICMSAHSHLHHAEDAYMGVLPQLILALPFLLALAVYLFCAAASKKKYRPWPIHRTACWVIGTCFAALSVAGPLASRGHTDFTMHMYGHLFLGMLAPLLMVLAAPMTLFLRTVSVPMARRLTKILASRPLQMLTHPITAALLNIGGLWLLYTTGLFTLMYDNTLLHLFVHIHVFLAGYLFTASMIYIDPVPHRFSYLYRSIILVLALAGHGILAKHLYANPPEGVALEQAQTGSMVMYYGGDMVDIVLIFILCLQWFRATRPKNAVQKADSR